MKSNKPQCRFKGCTETEVNKYYSIREGFIFSCLLHKPMGWKRVYQDERGDYIIYHHLKSGMDLKERLNVQDITEIKGGDTEQ